MISADELRSLKPSTPELSDNKLETISGVGRPIFMGMFDGFARSGIREGKTFVIGKACNN